MRDFMRARPALAIAVFFSIPGLAISSWVTRTPDLRDAINASTAEMGLVLLGLSIGSMAGILSSGVLVARFGTRAITMAGAVSVVLGVLTIGIGGLQQSAGVVSVGLALFGLGMGGGEVAMNIAGAELERHRSGDLLPLLHGAFSAGTTVGALAGIACNAAQVSPTIHLSVLALLSAGLALTAAPGLQAGVGRRERQRAKTSTSRLRVADPRLIIISVIVLAMAFAEGTANDWLPLVMVDGHGFTPATGSAIYALFAASMAIGRFAGGALSRRVSRTALLAGSATLGAAGLATVIFIDQPALVVAGVALWGAGASLGFPIALSAAGDSGPDSAARVSAASIIGYLAFLVGPPILGFLGEAVGLRHALIVVLVVVTVAVFMAPAASRTRTT